jgi:hypothetical protein
MTTLTRRRWRLLLPAALAACAIGCGTARGLSDLQREFDRALQFDDACRDPGGGARALECATGQQARYAAIADEAGRLAREASSPATRVALLRLEATAAWQAGRDDQARAAADRAQPLCEASDAAAGARDCAVLAVLPALIAVDRYGRAWAALRAAPGGDAATRVTALERQYRTQLWPQFNAAAAGAQRTPGLPESFGAYLDRQRVRSFCTYREVGREAVMVIGGLPFDPALGCPDTAAGLDDAAAMAERLAALRRAQPARPPTPEVQLAACRVHVIETELRARYAPGFDAARDCR